MVRMNGATSDSPGQLTCRWLPIPNPEPFKAQGRLRVKPGGRWGMTGFVTWVWAVLRAAPELPS